jgi:hypothetical protein
MFQMRFCWKWKVLLFVTVVVVLYSPTCALEFAQHYSPSASEDAEASYEIALMVANEAVDVAVVSTQTCPASQVEVQIDPQTNQRRLVVDGFGISVVKSYPSIEFL